MEEISKKIESYCNDIVILSKSNKEGHYKELYKKLIKLNDIVYENLEDKDYFKNNRNKNLKYNFEDMKFIHHEKYDEFLLPYFVFRCLPKKIKLELYNNFTNCLKPYLEKNQILKITNKMVMVFEYNNGFRGDGDNMQHKYIIDLITPYYVLDDTLEYLSTYIKSCPDNEYQTTIKIFNEEDFLSYIAKEK